MMRERSVQCYAEVVGLGAKVQGFVVVVDFLLMFSIQLAVETTALAQHPFHCIPVSISMQVAKSSTYAHFLDTEAGKSLNAFSSCGNGQVFQFLHIPRGNAQSEEVAWIVTVIGRTAGNSRGIGNICFLMVLRLGSSPNNNTLGLWANSSFATEKPYNS